MKKILMLIIIVFILSGCSLIKKDSNECCTCKDCPSCDMCCPCE